LDLSPQDEGVDLKKFLLFVLFVEMNKKLLLCVGSRIIPFNETSSVQGEIKASIPNSVFKLQ